MTTEDLGWPGARPSIRVGRAPGPTQYAAATPRRPMSGGGIGRGRHAVGQCISLEFRALQTYNC